MFSSVEQSPDFGYSSVITNTDQSLLDSSYETLHQYHQPEPTPAVFKQTAVQTQLKVLGPASFPPIAANNSANGWYTPQHFISSCTFPYFNSPHQHQTLQNTRLNGNFNCNGAPDNYIPNSCPSLVELLQETPLNPSVMISPQITQQAQDNRQYSKIQNLRNFRPTHNPINVHKKNKAKRIRTAFTTNQLEALETIYEKQVYVSKQDRQTLTKNLGITDRAIKVWFQNRRMKGKRDMGENSETSSADSSAGDVLENLENQMQQCVVINDYVSIPTDLSDKLGQLINEFVPKEFMENHVEEINSSLETSSVSLTSPGNVNHVQGTITISDDESVALENNSLCVESKKIIGEQSEINYYAINNSSNLRYEPISPAEGTPVEMPIWKPEEIKSLFDKHFC